VLTHNQLIGHLYGQICYWQYRFSLLHLSAHQVSTISVGAQYATQQWTASHCYRIESYAVSLFNISSYTTSQISMHCLTDLFVLLVAVESIFKNLQSASLYRYLWQSSESDYPDFYLLSPCLIQNLQTQHCSRLWSHPKMNVSLIVIWATLLCKSSSMLGGHQWM